MIFYFTATGNSLFAARTISAALGDPDLRSIPQAIHDEPPVYEDGAQDTDGKSPLYEDDAIGFVVPIFSHLMPPMVLNFIRKSQFKTNYFYVVLTYGNRTGGAADLAADFFASQQIAVDYANTLLMVDNWLPGFDIEEQLARDKHIDENLAAICEDLKTRKTYIQHATEADRAAHRQNLMFNFPFDRADVLENLLEFTDECVGCGICAKVCPAGCISIEDVAPDAAAQPSGGPQSDGFQNNAGQTDFHARSGTRRAVRRIDAGLGCTACLACIHACPSHAITTKAMPEKNPKVHFLNEHVSLRDIIRSNDQEDYR